MRLENAPLAGRCANLEVAERQIRERVGIIQGAFFGERLLGRNSRRDQQNQGRERPRGRSTTHRRHSACSSQQHALSESVRPIPRDPNGHRLRNISEAHSSASRNRPIELTASSRVRSTRACLYYLALVLRRGAHVLRSAVCSVVEFCHWTWSQDSVSFCSCSARNGSSRSRSISERDARE